MNDPNYPTNVTIGGKRDPPTIRLHALVPTIAAARWAVQNGPWRHDCWVQAYFAAAFAFI
jgi:hypothetical protein